MLQSNCNKIFIKKKQIKTKTNTLKNGSIIKEYTFNIVNAISEKKYLKHILNKTKPIWYSTWVRAKKKTEQNNWIECLQRHVISFSLGCLDSKIQIKTETNYVYYI